eukprot:3471655-Pleurochrysis_carterae.AAC.2
MHGDEVGDTLRAGRRDGARTSGSQPLDLAEFASSSLMITNPVFRHSRVASQEERLAARHRGVHADHCGGGARRPNELALLSDRWCLRLSTHLTNLTHRHMCVSGGRSVADCDDRARCSCQPLRYGA